jgi:multidrug efflux pump subunit AcrB
MKGISNAVITSSLVFMAVFIPVSFMGGTSGTFYTQFGLTMAVAVGISAINALTLSPALCALLLKPYINEDGTQKNNFAARIRTRTFTRTTGNGSTMTIRQKSATSIWPSSSFRRTSLTERPATRCPSLWPPTTTS